MAASGTPSTIDDAEAVALKLLDYLRLLDGRDLQALLLREDERADLALAFPDLLAQAEAAMRPLQADLRLARAHCPSVTAGACTERTAWEVALTLGKRVRGILEPSDGKVMLTAENAAALASLCQGLIAFENDDYSLVKALIQKEADALRVRHRGEESVVARPVKKKQSTAKGDAREKIIGALNKHHKYAEGSCLNLEPIGNNELARLAVVSESTASAFFKNEFNRGERGGFAKYRVICRDAGRLADSLKALNGEFSPHDLYGRRPAGEDERDDED